MGAPGYQSYAWTTQDWRTVQLHADGSWSYDRKCGDGSTLPSGRKRLCLPRSVLETLSRSRTGREIVRQQAERKQRADKGERVKYHPRIAKLIRKLEEETVQDDPSKARRNGRLSKAERQRRVSAKIRKLKAEGYGHDQAVAIALSMDDKGQIGPRGGYKRNGEKRLPTSVVPRKAIREYTEKHWGNAPDYVYEIPDDRLPATLVEMGKLEEIECYRIGKDGNPTDDTVIIKWPEDDRCILAFCPRTQRLYNAYPEAEHEDIARGLWRDDERHPWLGDVARAVGGERSRYRYPRVRVCIVGLVQHVIYYTHKKGDGPSRYIHHLGEDGGRQPVLCVDECGQTWWAGGDYTVEEHGIID